MLMKIAKCWWEEQWRRHAPNWNHCYKFWIERQLESCWLLILHKTTEFHSCFSRTIIVKYWEKHVSAAGFFLTNWKLSNNWCRSFRPAVVTEKITKSAKRQVYKLFKSTAFASYRIFLVQITTICFQKVQYMYISAWIALEYRSWS